jgi:MFS family permease
VGLLLMSGLTGTTSWTHLVLGFILAGVGSGMVNPPLASTAVGVVTPERSGMASGVNTTFRQIGISVGIALYGTIFSSALQNGLTHSLAPLHFSSQRVTTVVTSIKEGYANKVIDSVPRASRGEVVAALRSSFAGSLNDLLLVSGILALVGALAAMVLIRPKDFVSQHQQPATPEKTPAAN